MTWHLFSVNRFLCIMNSIWKAEQARRELELNFVFFLPGQVAGQPGDLCRQYQTNIKRAKQATRFVSS